MQKPEILLVEMDDETRPLLRQNLMIAGFEVIISLDEADAIARMQNQTKYPDLILLNQVGDSIENFLKMGLRLRSQLAFPAQTPIVVIADRFEEALSGQNQQVGANEYVTYPADAQQLMDLLHQLCD
ncbi:hypothetical protein [Almyronema epifaneia]|uniref:Response regulatory domain-containing protein n=1 Tax=Almyronema epifaneia S1 TaxID=2991925 RepID=A0ABW6IIM2_9CYAN